MKLCSLVRALYTLVGRVIVKFLVHRLPISAPNSKKSHCAFQHSGSGLRRRGETPFYQLHLPASLLWAESAAISFPTASTTYYISYGFSLLRHAAKKAQSIFIHACSARKDDEYTSLAVGKTDANFNRKYIIVDHFKSVHIGPSLPPFDPYPPTNNKVHCTITPASTSNFHLPSPTTPPRRPTIS